jgi:AcrR family transcriptional regulator
MSGKTGTIAPARKKADGTANSQERLLAVATEEFAAFGFEGTPIRKIASAAGLTLPTIYHFFGDKRALYERVCIAAFERANVTLEAALTSVEDPSARLLHFTTTLVTILHDDVNFMRLLQRELVEQDYPLIGSEVRAALVPHFEMVISAVAAIGRQSDMIDRTLAIYSLAFGLIQLGPVWQKLGHVDPSGRTPAQSAALILTLVFPEIDWAKAKRHRAVKSSPRRAAG